MIAQTALFIRAHGGDGILRAADVPSLQAASWRVFELLRDGERHTHDEIAKAANQRDYTRRLRDLNGMGCDIEPVRNGDGRDFVYVMRSASDRAVKAYEAWKAVQA